MINMLYSEKVKRIKELIKELNTYRNVCFSPYWLKYIELITHRNITEKP